jgi:predicted NAD-dependent protein-ADP-ribosyltransferase YbiA (DUF1768 family)/FtsZ-binding cell division protein ZapB
VDIGDIDGDRDLYEIELFNLPVIITVGNGKIRQDLTYYPLYFIKKNGKSIQIGLYEIYTKDVSTYTDEDGSLLMEDLGDPLIYKSVIPEYIEKNRFIDGVSNKMGEDADPDAATQKHGDLFTSIHAIDKLLPEETEEQANAIVAGYRAESGDSWIQRFLKNKNYAVKDNEGNGDCFFAVIRDAFTTIGQQTTVSSLRNKVAMAATEENFTTYKVRYDMYDKSIKDDSTNLLLIKKEIAELKENISQVSDTTNLSEQETQLKAQFKQIQKEQKESKENMRGVLFMKGVKNLEQFRSKIKKCEFWADEWAISVMEMLLNIKCIILSSKSYHDNDPINVLKCSSSQQETEFNPDYYILLEYTGEHYMLISYKKKGILKYSEIPYHIKKMVVERCMERVGGLFNHIPEFARLKQRMRPNASSSSDDEEADLADFETRELFDPSITFMIHPSIGKNVSPGKANGDVLDKTAKKDFVDLKDTEDWRKKLDDTWKAEFSLDGLRWISVENYIQANKFKNENPEFYRQFSLDADTRISNNPEFAKQVGESKSGIIKGEQVKPKKMKVDADYEKRKEKIQYVAQQAKFTQHPVLKKVLKDTRNAKLLYYVKGDSPISCVNLMKIRAII